MQTYSTSQIAKLIHVHPNTVRFYEEMKLLPPVPRQQNSYRVYNQYHLEQLRLIRIAFDSEIASGNLRKMTIEIIQLAAFGKLDNALKKTQDYKAQVDIQKKNAKEAIFIIESILQNTELCHGAETQKQSRKTVAASLGITIDVLRDWERNGLIDVPRDSKGYRMYGIQEMKRLKIIRTLRHAHYSMMAILRMLSQVDKHSPHNLLAVIDTPLPSEDIITATDQFITSLVHADRNADKILAHLTHMKTIT